MSGKNTSAFFSGVVAGVPIALGYFAVSFSLGIVARKAGLSAFEGFVASFFNLASAGEYALFNAVQQSVTYLEVAVITLVVNARYLLMSCSLSQQFSPETSVFERMIVGFAVTDEIFGVCVSRPYPLNPKYAYGVMSLPILLWSAGTSLGIAVGNILPPQVVDSLSVALYGMFIAIIIPPAKKNRVIAVAVAASFALSFAFSVAPLLKSLSSGNRTIILTVAISAVLAKLKPISDEGEN